jgi:WD40 repeat protein
MITSSSDKTIAIWNVNSSPPTLVRRIRGHTDAIDSIAIYKNLLYSSGGTKVAVVSLNDVRDN